MANNLLAGLVQGFAQTSNRRREQKENEELKKLQVKLFKQDLEEKDKQKQSLDQLISMMTNIPKPTTPTGEELQGPGREGRPLLDLLADPEGQALALQSGALNANQLARLTRPQEDFGGLFGGGAPAGFEPVGFDIGPSGKPTLKFKRSELDKPLSPAQLKTLRTEEGKKLPVGTTGRQAQEKGAKSISAAEEALELGQRGAEAVLGRLDELVADVFPEGKFLARAMAAPGILGSLITQDDPNVALYESLRKGTLAPIIRAMGEKGTLAEGDVKRAIELLPKLFPIPDSKEVATQKLAQIREILSNVKGKPGSTLSKEPPPPPGFRRVQ